MRKARHLLFAVFACTVVAVPALAQQTGSGGYPAPCPASQVSKADVDRAHTVFLSGKGFLDESNYDKAISYFKDAYSIDCSVHAILPIIATAYERKGDKQSAVQALQEYLKRVPNAPDREVVERRIKNLQDQIAHDQGAATAAPPPSATATAAPSATALPTSTAPAPPIATTEPTATAPTPPPEGAGHSVAPWIVVGAGGAALVTGVVLFAVGSGQVSDAEKVCGSGHTACPPTAAGNDAISKGNSGRTLETVGVVAGVVGVAAVAGGLVWHFAEKPGAPSTTGATLAPVVAPGYAGLGVGGRF